VSQELLLLLGSAAAIGGLHTLLGPDHYLPFISLSQARGWALRKTIVITLLCGFGHVASSVVLGSIGIAAGIAVQRLELIEGFRGNLAAWLLIAFGLAYGAWGFHQALRNRPHQHWHRHADGTAHNHSHGHQTDHAHPHAEGNRRLTPWILFTIFVLGPCEPLIPLLMYPAARQSPGGAVAVAAVFGVVTLGTMTAVVVLAHQGLKLFSAPRLTRFAHALAGLTLLLCGLAIQFGL
jgi:sulfite exporter TauE/SafE